MEAFMDKYSNHRMIYLKDDEFIDDDSDGYDNTVNFYCNSRGYLKEIKVTIDLIDLSLCYLEDSSDENFSVSIEPIELNTSYYSRDTTIIHDIQTFLKVDDLEEFEGRLKVVIRELSARFQAFIHAPLLLNNTKKA